VRGADRPGPVHLAAWGVLIACLAAQAWWLAPHATRPLTWDEVDYVVAARRGVLANLVDEGTWSPLGFVRFVAAKGRGRSGDDVATAHGYDEGRDLFRLRHMHPPLWIAPLAPALAAVPPEPAARWAQLGWVAALGLAFLLAARAVAPGRPLLVAAALAVVLLDPLLRFSLLEMHAHVAFAAAFLLPLAAVASRAPAPLVGAALGVLFSVATLGPAWSALWLVLLLPSAELRSALRDRVGWLRAGGAALAAVAILWPGGLLRLGLVQEHAFRAYNLLFLEGAEWSSAGGVVLDLLGRHPGLAALALLAVAGYALGLRRRDPALVALGAGAVAFAALSLPFLIIPRYALGGVALGVLVVLAFARDARPAVAAWVPRGALVLVAVLAWAGRGFPAPSAADAEESRQEHAFVADRAAAGEAVAAEAGHIYAFYAGEAARGIEPVRVDYDGARLIRRVGTHWETFAPDGVDRVILLRRGGAEPPVFDSLGARCVRVDRPVAVHFTCGGA